MKAIFALVHDMIPFANHWCDGEYVIFYNNGIAERVEESALKRRLLNFKNSGLYAENAKERYAKKDKDTISYAKEILYLISEIDYNFELLFKIDDYDTLLVYNDKLFSKIISGKTVRYIGVEEFSNTHAIPKSTLKKLLKDDKIEGAIAIYSKQGNVSAYAIPEDAEVN